MLIPLFESFVLCGSNHPPTTVHRDQKGKEQPSRSLIEYREEQWSL